MLRNAILAALVALVTLPAIADSTDSTLADDTITIRAIIRGEDVVKVRRDRVWFNHISGDLPSNVKVNGKPWVPAWNEGVSEAYVMTDPPRFLPMKVRGRSRVFVTSSTPKKDAVVKVVEYPNEFNGWALTISLKSMTPEPTWVDVTISWEIDLTPITLPRRFDICTTQPSPTPVGLR